MKRIAVLTSRRRLWNECLYLEERYVRDYIMGWKYTGIVRGYDGMINDNFIGDGRPFGRQHYTKRCTILKSARSAMIPEPKKDVQGL